MGSSRETLNLKLVLGTPDSVRNCVWVFSVGLRLNTSLFHTDIPNEILKFTNLPFVAPFSHSKNDSFSKLPDNNFFFLQYWELNLEPCAG
jgi:hypothetical protein